jgi:hypothetical protein
MESASSEASTPTDSRSPAGHGWASPSTTPSSQQMVPAVRACLPLDLAHTRDLSGSRQLAFANGHDAATNWLNQTSRVPDVDPTTDATILDVELHRAAWINDMIDAVYDLAICKDSKGMKMHFVSTSASYFPNLHVEAACQVLFDKLIERCRTGFGRLPRYDETRDCGCPPEDKSDNCFNRATNVVTALRTWKSICKGMIDDDTKKWQLVNAPLKTMGKKRIQRHNNNTKSRTAEAGKKAREKLEVLKVPDEATKIVASTIQSTVSPRYYESPMFPMTTPTGECMPMSPFDSSPNFYTGPQPPLAPLQVPYPQSPNYTAYPHATYSLHTGASPLNTFTPSQYGQSSAVPVVPSFPGDGNQANTVKNLNRHNTHNYKIRTRDTHYHLATPGVGLSGALDSRVSSPFASTPGGMSQTCTGPMFKHVAQASDHQAGGSVFSPSMAQYPQSPAPVATFAPGPPMMQGDYPHIGSKKHARTASMDVASLPPAQRQKTSENSAADLNVVDLELFTPNSSLGGDEHGNDVDADGDETE